MWSMTQIPQKVIYCKYLLPVAVCLLVYMFTYLQYIFKTLMRFYLNQKFKSCSPSSDLHYMYCVCFFGFIKEVLKTLLVFIFI